MPWKAFKVENEFCVFRIDAQSNRFGKSLGCHSTKDKANKQVAALNIAEPQNKDTVSSTPRNKRGYTVSETFSIVAQSQKFSKEEVGYTKPAPIPETVCGTCRFYLRDEDFETGECQVVSGPIDWYATSDLYISATQESQASFQGMNAYSDIYNEDGTRKEMNEKADIRTPKKTPLGTFLRKVRVSKNMSTSDLEKKMPIDESTIAKIETGVISVPGRPILNAFAKALGIPIKDLLGKLPKDKQPAANIAPGGRPVGKETKDPVIITEDEFIESLENPSILDETKEKKSIETKRFGEVRDLGFAMTFEEVEKDEEARAKAREVRETSNMVPELTRNIMRLAPLGERAGLLTKVVDGFKARVSGMFGNSEHENETETKTEIEIEVESEKSTSTFMVFKEGDEYRFVTTYSNNIRDTDNPPEIISAKSHERFEAMVDKGKVPLPEVWLWHTEDWHIGQTDVITYDKENGIAIAAGHFFPEASDIAEAIYQNQEHWGVSHGMPSDSIVRNQKDRTIIEQHITKEISPLPRYAAANKWAEWTILKEKIMTISQEKKDKLAEFGVNNNMLSGIEANNQEVSKQADELNLERKEETPLDESTKEETPVDEKKEDTKDTSVFSKEQAEELGDVFKILSEKITKSVLEQVKEVLAPIAEKLDADEKTLEKEFEDRIKSTPPASLQAWIYGDDINLKSATDASETKVDGRTTLGKDSPSETDEKEFVMNSGDGFADSLMTRIVNDTTTKELEAA